MSVLEDIGTGKDRTRQIREKNISPDSFEMFFVIERFTDCDKINRTITSKELKHRFVDKRVGWIIKIIGNKEVTHLKYPILIEEDRSEYTALSIGTMGENFEVQKKLRVKK